MQKVIDIQGGQKLVAVRDGDQVILRIQKDGHNRGIAKLDAAGIAALAEVLGAK